MPARALRTAALAALAAASLASPAAAQSAGDLLASLLGLGKPAQSRPQRVPQQPPIDALEKPLKILPAGLPSRLPEPGSGADAEQGAAPAAAPAEPPQGVAAPSYITMCVRLCDGYYWPISSPTRPADIRRDKDLCEASCATPAELFVRPSLGAAPAEMRSLSGQPYRKLKSAFLYRKSKVRRCGCKPEPWSEAELARHEEYALAERTARLQAEMEAEMAAAQLASLSQEQTPEGEADGALVMTDADASVENLPEELPKLKDSPSPPGAGVRITYLVPPRAGGGMLQIRVPARPPVARFAAPAIKAPAPAALPASASSPGSAAALAPRRQLIKDPRQLTVQHR